MAAPDMTMKLLIDPKGRRVLYAEAGKDVVDFLLSILSLPLGSVTKLLTSNEMAGSIGNLYHSIQDLSDAYILPNKSKKMLLNPVLANPSAANSPLLLPTNHQPSTKKTLYRCSGFHSKKSYISINFNCVPYVTCNPNERCPNCNNLMNSTATIVGQVKEESSSFEGGFVQGLVPYMIMDDLVVKPLSTISVFFNKFNVNEMGSLQEKKVKLTMDEGKKLLKASLHSKTVLTDVFFQEVFVEEKISIESVWKFLNASWQTKNVLTNVFFEEKMVAEEEKSEEKSLESVELCYL